jgi:hypothetical protein
VRPVCRQTAAGAGAALALLVALAPSTASGAGRTYSVVQCHPLNRAHVNAVLEDTSTYSARSFCGDPRNGHALRVTNILGARHGGFGRVRWRTGSSDLGIVSVDVRAKLRRDNGHAPRLWMADGHLNEVARFGSGHHGGTGYRHYRWGTIRPGRRQFVASLTCERPDGCRRSDAAKAWVRDVRLKVADYADPTFTSLGGTLLASGWLRGPETIQAQFSDHGSGLAKLSVMVNGSPVAQRRGTCDRIPGTTYAARFAVCGREALLSGNPATSEAPFHDGRNSVSVCAVDFAGNRTCERRTVKADNTPPAIAFRSSQDRDDPELIRLHVSDAASGVSSGRVFYRHAGRAAWRALGTRVRSGELRARVDSTVPPPGEYEFMARATDGAGNSARTTTRTDGLPMVLTFPLKSAAELSAHLTPGGSSRLTIGYGRSATVAGRLSDPSGEPLADQKVTVTERFGAGALMHRRVRTVRTDADGVWSESLPAGPSRAVSASYGGSRRYLPDRARAGSLSVRTKVTLHLSRPRVHEGGRVAFRGRVAHRGARIPAGGKLVALQVKDGPRWNTVRQTFNTGAAGHYRMRYRFARFYTSNVSYRFRIKVLRESGWPYKAPVSSRAKRLVVEAR